MQIECCCCKVTKDCSGFQKHKSTKTGFQKQCRDCRKSYARTLNGKAMQKSRSQTYGKTKAGIASRIASKKRFRQTERGKITGKAQDAVNNAIKGGKLKKANEYACKYCLVKNEPTYLKRADEYHHWKGYAKEYWLDVIPLCTTCHGKADYPTPA